MTSTGEGGTRDGVGGQGRYCTTIFRLACLTPIGMPWSHRHIMLVFSENLQFWLSEAALCPGGARYSKESKELTMECVKIVEKEFPTDVEMVRHLDALTPSRPTAWSTALSCSIAQSPHD